MSTLHMRLPPVFAGALLLAIAVCAVGLWPLMSVMAEPLVAAQAPAEGTLLAPAGITVTSLPDSTCVLDGDTRTCELWAKPGVVQMPTGDQIPIWGLSDSAGGGAHLPGPALIANVGETLVVIFHNQIPGETISLTFPGQEGLFPDLEGVEEGGSVTYSFVLEQPGTYLYEAGMTPNGARQVAMGLYGGMVVRPATAGQAYDGINTAYDDEVLLVLSEIDPLFNNDPHGALMTEFSPRYFLINDMPYPWAEEIETLPGNRILLRFVNPGLKTHSMGLLGVGQTLIARDADARQPGRQALVENLSAGQTMDTVVTVPPDAYADTLYTLYDTNTLLHNSSYCAGPDEPVAFGGMMTFIRTLEGAMLPETGPTTTVSVAPQNTTGADGVTLSVRIDDSLTGNLNVTAAEYFLDMVGAQGTGTSLAVGAPGPVVEFEHFIPAGTLAGWESGSRVIYVRGMDSASTWGPAGSVVLNLDKEGPYAVGISLFPQPANGTRSVLLRATGDDRKNGRNNVVAGVYTLDGGPAEPMELSRTDAQIVAMTAMLSSEVLTDLPEGIHPIEITAQDALGNWGHPGQIDLVLDKTGPEAPMVTLSPSTLVLSGPPPVTHVRVTANIADAVSSGVQSSLMNAEGFLWAEGPVGTGFRLFPKDGLFNSPTEVAYLDIPIGSFIFLAQGEHPVMVRGLDAAGNWGELGTAMITIDRGATDTQGPMISSLTVSPNPTNGAPTVTLMAGAADPGLLSNIASGEWFVGTDPGLGQGMQLQAVDGAFDSPTEMMRAVIDVSNWSNGSYRIWVRARDTLSNWGNLASVQLLVRGNSPTGILYDSFEDGLGAWTAVIGGVTTTPDAVLASDGGVMGMRADVGGIVGAEAQDDAQPAYVVKLLPAGEASLVVEFYWAPNGSDMGSEPQDILVGLHHGAPVLGIQTASPGNTQAYQVRGWALVDGVERYTEWYDVADEAHKLKLTWNASKAGWLWFSIDDVLMEELSALNTSDYRVHEIWLGPSTVDPSASGAQYLDGLAVARQIVVYLPMATR